MELELKRILMSTLDMRGEVADWLTDLDDEFLAAVHTIVGNYVNERRRKKAFRGEAVVGYEPDGTAITKNDLVERAQASEEDIAAGRLYSTEEVRAQLDL